MAEPEKHVDFVIRTLRELYLYHDDQRRDDQHRDDQQRDELQHQDRRNDDRRNDDGGG